MSVMQTAFNASNRLAGVSGSHAVHHVQACSHLLRYRNSSRAGVRVMCSQPAAEASGPVDAELPVAQTPDEYNAALATAYSEVEEEQKVAPFTVEKFFPSYANVVTMTGTLAADPVIRSFNSGSTIATVTLRVRRPNTKLVDTYFVEAWDDLAHRFELHLKKGTRLQVHGSLKVDRYNHKETGAPQTKTSINANSAWIIEPSTIPPESDCRIPEELWDELRNTPGSFWDNRTSKVNPRAPDFVHKASGDALWASSDPPAWYLEENAYVSHTGPQLEPAMHGDAMDQTQAAPADNGDAFAEIAAAGATPGAWGDVAATAPAGPAATDRWGGSGSSYFGGGGGGGGFSAGGGRTAAPRSRVAPRGGGQSSGQSLDMAALWQEYADSPRSFWDNREGKRNPRAPDFKHKETGKGLWIESAPAWFDPSMVPAKAAGGGGSGRPSQAAMDKLWQQLMLSPQDFWDNRAKKLSPRSPDFKHKKSGDALWLNSKPEWVNISDSAAAPMQAMDA